MNYSEQLKDPRWQNKRLEIMQRDNFTCQCCEDNDNELDVHVTKYIYGYKVWEYENSDLVTLCHNCHDLVLLDKKKKKLLIDLFYIFPDSTSEIVSII